jgi:hypothetical protein
MAWLQEQEEDDHSMVQRRQHVAQEEGPGPRQRSAAGMVRRPLGERQHKDLLTSSRSCPRSWRGHGGDVPWGSGGRQAQEEGVGRRSAAGDGEAPFSFPRPWPGHSGEDGHNGDRRAGPEW